MTAARFHGRGDVGVEDLPEPHPGGAGADVTFEHEESDVKILVHP